MTTGTFLDRAAWGANPSFPRLGHVVPRSQFVGLVEHHTVIVMADWDHDGMIDGDLGDIRHYMRALQTARPDLGLDVPYSFVVFRGVDEYDHIVCEGRGFDRTGAHTAGYNSTRYGVALAGDFTNLAPTIGMLAGVRWVGAQLDDPIGARPTIGHRDTKATACPGAMAYPLLDRLQPPFTASNPGDDDMTPQELATALGPAAQLGQDGVIRLLVGVEWVPLGSVLAFTKDEITRPDLLEARIAAHCAGGGAGPSVEAVADEFARRLARDA